MASAITLSLVNGFVADERRAIEREAEAQKSIIIAGEGDPCPRCGKPMQIRAYADVVYEQLRATSF
jgi:hypothetical protein